MERVNYTLTAQGFIFLYDITSRPSFDYLAQLQQAINAARTGSPYSLVICANKSDLTDKRQVGPEEGQALANNWNCPFFETSAKYATNVDSAFHELVQSIRKQSDADKAKDKSKCETM